MAVKDQLMLSNDPIWSALVAATGLHLLVLGGFGFGIDLDFSRAKPNSVAVTFALSASSLAPEEARHIASQDQTGALEDGDFAAPQMIATMSIATGESELSDDGAPTTESIEEQLAALERDVSALSDNAVNSNPRAGAVAARRSLDADYLARWRARVEQVGNAIYGGVQRKADDGDVRLLVVVRADGSLEVVTLLKSSGNRALDSAAIATVRSAAPFPAFPTSLRQQTQRLEIVRTWQFRGQSLSSP